jgi:bifunctional ADP-heptose synthase (sugar kinase/adenylyltransferase)
MNGTGDKVRRLGEAITWRTRQLGPVVFTNGVFDILHRGHVTYLARALANA